MKISKKSKINGITLIALVITIIVLLILAGISISMLTGNNGILQKVTDAKEKTEKAQIIENAQTDILGQQTENKSANITKEQLAGILNKYFIPTEPTTIPDEVSSTSDIPLTTIDEKYTIYLSEIFKGKFSTQNNVVTLGEKYDEYENNNNSLIGKTIDYTSANHTGDIQTAGGWIILGKQTTAGKEGIIITTKNPVSTQEIQYTLTEWIGYEEKISSSCKNYVGQTGTLGTKAADIKEVRSITLDDINNAVGFNESINSFTINNNSGGFAYPNSAGTGWIKNTDSEYSSYSTNSTEIYYYLNDNGYKLYSTTNNYSGASVTLGKLTNMKYILANNTSYWAASRSLDIYSIGVNYSVASIEDGYIGYNNTILCESNTSGGYDNGGDYSIALRPVIILSSETPWDDVKDLIGNYAQY